MNLKTNTHSDPLTFLNDNVSDLTSAVSLRKSLCNADEMLSHLEDVLHDELGDQVTIFRGSVRDLLHTTTVLVEELKNQNPNFNLSSQCILDFINQVVDILDKMRHEHRFALYSMICGDFISAPTARILSAQIGGNPQTWINWSVSPSDWVIS